MPPVLGPDHPMSRLDEVGELDGWRCWLCDEPVDRAMSVNDPRGASVDAVVTKAKAKGKHGAPQERLAHRACNTKKGAITPVVRWPEHLFVADAAPILVAVERLQRKGGRELMARCPSPADAEQTSAWLVDRLSRLQPGLEVSAEIERGGGQFLVILRA